MDSDLYKQKYRVASTRAPCWDYSSPGSYFVTICTKGMKCWFGKITAGKMKYSRIGGIALETWQLLPQQYLQIQIDEFVIMPNHIHGIITIKTTFSCRDAINRVSTTGGATGKNNPMGKQKLGEFVRWYKGRTTFFTRKYNPNFAWQSRFYDVIITDEKQFEKIQEYIECNPYSWAKDSYFVG